MWVCSIVTGDNSDVGNEQFVLGPPCNYVCVCILTHTYPLTYTGTCRSAIWDVVRFAFVCVHQDSHAHALTPLCRGLFACEYIRVYVRHIQSFACTHLYIHTQYRSGCILTFDICICTYIYQDIYIHTFIHMSRYTQTCAYVHTYACIWYNDVTLLRLYVYN